MVSGTVRLGDFQPQRTHRTQRFIWADEASAYNFADVADVA